MPKKSVTSRRMSGTRVMPPTSSTASTAAGAMPASFITDSHTAMQRLDSALAQLLEEARG